MTATAAVSTDSRRHGTKYCYATWITGVLAGTDHCAWKPWYRSTYRYAKLVDINKQALDAWIVEHNAMVEARVAALKVDGWTVTVEEENAFKLKGRTVLLAGKPDIVAFRELDALIIDEKSGAPRPSDEWQVLLYMFAIPRVGHLQQRRANVRGEVEYRGSSLSVPLTRLDAAASTRIVATLQAIGSEAEPARTPSLTECAFCDIAACPDRMSAPEHSGQSEDF